LIHINSPDKTLLTYKLDVIASKLSVFPNIYEVEAVGIKAINKELRNPYVIILAFKSSQL